MEWSGFKGGILLSDLWNGSKGELRGGIEGSFILSEHCLVLSDTDMWSYFLYARLSEHRGTHLKMGYWYVLPSKPFFHALLTIPYNPYFSLKYDKI